MKKRPILIRSAHDRTAETEIAGVPVKIGTEAECEQADFVVCGTVSHFTDDRHGRCSVCEARVVYRPHAPTTPPKICYDCFVAMNGETH